MTISRAADPPGGLARPARSEPRVSRLGSAALPRGVARAQLDALAGVVEDLAGQFELRPLLERILRHAVGLLGCDSGSICTVDEHVGTYRKEVDLGVACRSGDEFPLTEGVTGEILRAGGPVTFAEYAQVRGGHIDAADRRDLHAVIGVPIMWAATVIGTCIVFSRDPARRFEAPDITLLELFAGHAGLAMVNARMHAHAAELARTEATGLERERVVRDVHDSVARALASVLLHLGNAQPAVPDGEVPAGNGRAANGRDSGDVGDGGDSGGAGSGGAGSGRRVENGRDHLDLARQAAATALTETRRDVLGLRPVMPAAPTVEQAIRTQVDRARTTGLDIRLVVAGPSRTVPSEVVDRLFGLAQQAIANIVAHAAARTARVGLVYGADELVLLIQDDGVGFDAAALPRPDGSRAGSAGRGLTELAGIAARAEHLGAAVQIDATPGWGTTIRAAIPYLSSTPDAPRARQTVLIVEHRPLVRAGLVAVLGDIGPAVQVVGEVDCHDDVLDAYRLLEPDVVVIDLALPGGAAPVITQLRGHDADAAVVAIGDTASSSQGRDMRDAVRAGARATVTTEADGSALARAIAAAARGGVLFADEVVQGRSAGPIVGLPGDPHVPGARLTPREDEVRSLVSRGLPDKQIAQRLHISVKTVEKHVGSALRKTGARNRTELTAMNGRSHR